MGHSLSPSLCLLVAGASHKAWNFTLFPSIIAPEIFDAYITFATSFCVYFIWLLLITVATFYYIFFLITCIFSQFSVPNYAKQCISCQKEKEFNFFLEVLDPLIHLTSVSSLNVKSHSFKPYSYQNVSPHSAIRYSMSSDTSFLQ